MCLLSIFWVFSLPTVCCSADMTLVSAPAIGVITCDTKGLQQSLELQKDLVFTRAETRSLVPEIKIFGTKTRVNEINALCVP